MRELAKSMLSFSWAMSLFGLKQIANALAPADAAASLDAVTRCTQGQLGQPTQSAFQAVDNLQRGLVDLTFGLLTGGLRLPGQSRGGAGRGNQAGNGWSDAGQRSGGLQGDRAQPADGVPGAQPAGGTQGSGGQPGGWSQGGWSQQGGGAQGGGQQSGWIYGGAGPQGGGTRDGGGQQGGWTYVGVSPESAEALGVGSPQSGWSPSELPGDAPGGWSQGGSGAGTAGQAWSIPGDASPAAAASGLAQEAGNWTAQAVSGGIDLVQQGIDAAAQFTAAGAVQQPGGSGGSQVSSPGEFQTSGGRQP